jgi:hypothetical protein
MGQAGLDFQAKTNRNVKAQQVQPDELWAFCYATDKSPPDSIRGLPGGGPIRMRAVLDADSKLGTSVMSRQQLSLIAPAWPGWIRW